MIPFKTISNSNTDRCHFFHANGYPPSAYKSLLKSISDSYSIQAMFLRQFWKEPSNPKDLKNWDIFLDDLMQYANENGIINEYAIGHSIGGNILLRSALRNNKLYKSIVLLDPTIFSPSVIYIWRILSYFRLHPLIRKTRARRKIFNSLQEVFKSYRSKDIFSRIGDTQLNEYIHSIFNNNNNKVELCYNLRWEEIMYLTSGIKDFNIWKNLEHMKTPTLIIIPDESPVLRYFASKKILKNKFITIKKLKGSTHLFPLEQPEKTSQIILNFFSK